MRASDTGWPVSRVLSWPCQAMDDHSSGACVAAGFARPTRRAGRKHPRRSGRNPPTALPIRPCSRWGLPCRRHCWKRGGLLPHRFTLAVRVPKGADRAVCFLWHFPWAFARRSLTGTVFPWSPDFPPEPRSLAAPAVAQPSGIAGLLRPKGGRGQASVSDATA